MSRLTGHLVVAVVGKLKEPHWKMAQEAYVKRLQRYTHFALVEVKDMVGKGLPDVAAMQREGEALLLAGAEASYKIALTPTGRPFSSPQLAQTLQKWVEENGRLTFFVGGPAGFPPELLAGCQEQLSLSALTFPHELARIILLEQLYRAFTILNGEKYHK